MVVPEFDYYGNTEIARETWERIMLAADGMGGSVKIVMDEINSWASSFLTVESVITVLGI